MDKQPKTDYWQEQRQRLQEAYDQTPKVFIGCIYGRPKCGKTHLLGTLPKPLLVQSFDPQGTSTLAANFDKELREGKILVDSSFEDETVEVKGGLLTGARQYQRWLVEVRKMIATDVFSHLASFAVDSLTFFGDAIMNAQVQKEKRAEGHPTQKDWLQAQNALKQHLVHLASVCNNKGCNFVLTGHGEIERDEKEGTIIGSVTAVGKRSKVQIPPIFSELYYLERLRDGSVEIHTTPFNKFEAGSRYGGAKLKSTEKPDFKYILKKVGLPHEDREA